MLLVLITVVSCAVKAQDTLWFHSADRFKAHQMEVMSQYDSVVVKGSLMRFYYKPELGKTTAYKTRNISPSTYDYYTFKDPGRIIYNL